MEAGSEDEENSFQKKKDILLRQYQIKLVSDAEKQNTIIFLPTGAGKTFIALWIIKSRSSEVRPPYDEGGKRTFFLVNTKSLVEQQASVIEEQTDLTVGRYTGDMNVDFWNNKKWLQELKEHQVMVMTAQILLNMLAAAFISLDKINVIVFDECHHAVSDHPYRVIMRQFENVRKENQPLVLGLSATILNGNLKTKEDKISNLMAKVSQNVCELETTFQAKVATSEELSDVLTFSTCPDEQIKPCQDVHQDDTYRLICKIYEDAKSYLQHVIFPVDEDDDAVDAPADCVRFKKDNSMNKKVKNALDDAMTHLKLLGLYGGAVAALYHMIQFEKMRMDSDNEGDAELITFIITTLNKIRRIMMKKLPASDTLENVLGYSSPKVCSLLRTLLEHKRRSEQKQEKLACLVFVERRVTAVVLYHILKVLSKENRELNFITPDFMVGGTGNPMSNTRECMLEQMRNEDVIKKFAAHEINLLVATDVVEEGIDLPSCNLVIKFDKPKDYRSYVQSKGRARNKISEYVLLIGTEDLSKFESSLGNYRDTESGLKELLIGKTDLREVPSDDTVANELYKTDIEPYYASGPGSAYVTGESAISCIERYCQMLPQDKYSLLAPFVWLKKKKYEYVENEVQERRTAILQLPIACPIRENIEGDPMSNSKVAKRSVFIKAVKLLHERGELTDDLLPRKRVVDVSDLQYLFPHYVQEKIPKDKPQPGTKQRTQIYSIQHPKCLSECLPEPGKTLYLHVISTKPVYDRPADHRRGTMYDLLNSATGYAILSSKKMPQICKFPIFTTPGQVDCDLVVNATELTLTEAQIAELKKFHFDIFAKLLDLVKSSFAFDNSNEENSFFIVPVDKSSNGSYQIIWEIVTKRDSFPERYRPIYGKDKSVKRILAEFYTEEELEESKKALKRILMEKEEQDGNEPPSNKKMKMDTIHVPADSELEALEITEEKYNLTVVTPYYRINNIYYLVTRVCSDMTPMSKFPDNFETYHDYFNIKYDLNIRQKNQPLLEVKALSNSYNFLRPRIPAKTGGIKGKKKRLEEQDGFDEHLVPELCTHFPFPAGLWLKATLLPSILYRIANICAIEEFRQRVARETGLGTVDLPAKAVWRPFTVDESCLKGQDEENGKGVVLNRGILNHKPSVPDSFKKQIYSWGDEEIPIDLERNLNAIAPCDLVHYVQFVNKRLDEQNSRVSPSRIEVLEGFNMPIVVAQKVFINLELIAPKPINSKLELAELIQAFTTSKANDICSFERLETLGDSFLKFAAAVFAYRKFREFDEGKLASLKDKIVGNKNLLYCARAKGFASTIIVDDFQPQSDWNPPLLKIPKLLADGICSRNLGMSTIYELFVDPQEQFSGNLSSQTISTIEDILNEGKESDKSSTMELLLSRKTIPDKTVADCSEALIGVYLKNFGIEGGFKFLNWLGAMPEANYGELIGTGLENAYLQGANREKDIYFHLKGIDCGRLEKTLNYEFREKSFLLEALTHSSYVKNRLTYNYQRLEFLGDAILDFLITCYIYQHCGNLTPGKVTDLRSALVNNVTFACLAVKYNFHKYLLSLSSSLMDPVNRFVKYQVQRNHLVDDSVLILLDESECRLAEAVEVPKVLGDIFESLAGAIFLDSNNSLETVWKVFYPLMKKEIDAFSKDTPKQPIRLLYESLSYKPIMQVSICPDKINVMNTIEIMSSGGPEFFHGVGRNKRLATNSAAKHALKHILDKRDN